MIFWKQQEGVEDKLQRYFGHCDACFDQFEVAFSYYLEHGIDEHFASQVDKTHQIESNADDLRREIEHLLYGKALLPESRGDILGLLETYDRLPNIAETILFVVQSQHMVLPDDLRPELKKLCDVNLKTYRILRQAVELLMTNPKATLGATKEVDQLESESDQLERALITQIFQRKEDNGTKILWKELVLLIGEISDRAERVADRIGLVAIKRQI